MLNTKIELVQNGCADNFTEFILQFFKIVFLH